MSSEGDFREFTDLEAQDQSLVKRSYRKWFGASQHSRAVVSTGPLLNSQEDSNFGNQCRQIYRKDPFATELFESRKAVDVEQFVAELEANEYEYWKLLRMCLSADCRLFSQYQPVNKSLKSFLYALLKAINPECVLEDLPTGEGDKGGDGPKVGSEAAEAVEEGELVVGPVQAEGGTGEAAKEQRQSLDGSGKKETASCIEPGMTGTDEPNVKAPAAAESQQKQAVKPGTAQPHSNRRKHSHERNQTPPQKSHVPEFESPVKNPTTGKFKDKDDAREKNNGNQVAQKEYPKSYYQSKGKSSFYDSREYNRNSENQGRRDDYNQRNAYSRRTRY